MVIASGHAVSAPAPLALCTRLALASAVIWDRSQPLARNRAGALARARRCCGSDTRLL